MTEFVDLPFATEIVDPGDFSIPNARRFVASVSRLPFAGLLECRKATGDAAREVVIFDVEVERPQHLQNPIARRERLAIVFFSDEGAIPDVLALRADFPEVPHLNLRPYVAPKSLCLYDEDPYDIMLYWSPLHFMERIRQWLNLTSRGALHQDDQPLEPLLLSSAGTLVITDATYNTLLSEGNVSMNVYRLSAEKEVPMMLFGSQAHHAQRDGKPPFVCMGFLCDATTHGIVRRQPENLADLARLLRDCGLDLIAQLRARLTTWCQQPKSVNQQSDSLPILLVAFPKKRTPDGEVEGVETWAFCSSIKMVDVGVALGVWGMTGNRIGLHLVPDDAKGGDEIKISPLRVMRSFSRAAAAALSGSHEPDTRRIFQVGVGALGSHLFMNLVRAGIGQWTVADNDRLLPHNLARHALDGVAVGHYKSDYLSFVANQMIDGDSVAKAIVADVLRPGDKVVEITAAEMESDTIIDCSASISVARHLAIDVDSAARRFSSFLAPSGQSSILLAEDTGRTVPLDLLEMQYYREIANNERLRSHFVVNGRPIRYGQSCRDITSQIPQDMVALHGSLASVAVKRSLHDVEAFGCIWTLDPETGAVEVIQIQSSPMIQVDSGEWKIRTDEAFINKLAELRAGKLPNETGGVIIGSHDMQRRIVYLVDTIPSPPDSEEWPAVYIRGCKGLAREVGRIEQQTAGNLGYVGEWHSHPNGASIMPSRDDMKAFCWLHENMSAAGLPPLMMIVGDKARFAAFIETMD